MIEIQHLAYRLKDRYLLQGIDFRVPQGELCAIVGPNGAGKSTLMRLLSGDLTTTEGEMKWQGRLLSSFQTLEIARQRAILMQKTSMSMALRGEEVVMMGRYPHFKHTPRPIDLQYVQEAMELTACQQFADRLYQSLSGGEQQRIQLARVFCQLADQKGPYLLLLDEPLNNLDLQYQHLLLKACRVFAAQGNCVLIVMHDLNLAAQYADSILLLSGGKQLAFGRPQSVCRSDLLSKVYQLDLRVMRHPSGDFPLIIPPANESVPMINYLS
ncbi:MAG: heme ABC transporter ATP-binding protein [Bacteroidota bacterium]